MAIGRTSLFVERPHEYFYLASSVAMEAPADRARGICLNLRHDRIGDATFSLSRGQAPTYNQSELDPAGRRLLRPRTWRTMVMHRSRLGEDSWRPLPRLRLDLVAWPFYRAALQVGSGL